MKKTDAVKRLIRYAGRGGRALIALSAVMAFFTVAISLYMPILTGNAVDNILSPGNVAFHAVLRLIARLLMCAGLSAVIQWGMTAINNRMAYICARGVRAAAFDTLCRLPLSYLDRRGAGDTVGRIITDVDTLTDGLLMGFTQLFTSALTIALTLIVMFVINPAIAAVVVVVTPLSLLAASFIAKRTYTLFSKQAEVRGEQTRFVDEMIGGMKTVQAFGREKEALARFDGLNERLTRVSLKAIFYSSITNPSTRFVNAIVYLLVAVFGALACTKDALTVGSLICFLSYASQYTKPFNEISGVFAELQNTVACAKRVFDLIDEPTEPADAAGPAVFPEKGGAVALEHVCFSYDPQRELIRDLNLLAKPGARVAIVGPTGCGKTTLINLLMRFYDADSGRISVDGADILGVPRRELRAKYGMVLQDTWLRAGTIRDNIRMGDPDATDDRVIHAAKAARAHSFITRLPNGYDTRLGEDGGALSQGQKQLLCIARVMLRIPPILILDEATSSIDTRTEIKIQEAFQLMMRGRTSFVVAHRLSTIRSADTILVMQNGKIIEQGTHAQLMEKHGFYSALYMSQYR